MKNFKREVKKIEDKLSRVSNESSANVKEMVEIVKILIGAFAKIMEIFPESEKECCEEIAKTLDLLEPFCKKKR